MAFVSGGQGLWSTLDDYLAFARMFVGDGAVDGVRLLRPETLALMTSNRLTASQRATAEMLGMPLFATGHGFGLGVAVVMDPEKARCRCACGGGVGHGGLAGRLRRLVAGRSDRRLGDDLPGAQHDRAGTARRRRRPRRLWRHHALPRAGLGQPARRPLIRPARPLSTFLLPQGEKDAKADNKAGPAPSSLPGPAFVVVAQPAQLVVQRSSRACSSARSLSLIEPWWR